MVALDLPESTVEKIYAGYEARQRASSPRPHLGASEVGKECERALWYGFRWVQRASFPGRILRLFSTGNLEETRLVNDLQAIGIEIHPFELKTGRQFSFSLFGGHFGGSLDAIARGFVEAPTAWHLVEFKTHNDSSFKKLVKEGVRGAKPEHFFQIQSYMGMSHEKGQDQVPKLKRAFYFAVNKNTDDIFGERLEYQPEIYEHVQTRAARIIFSQVPMPKIAKDPKAFCCKFCNYHTICHGVGDDMQLPAANCRTCCHVTVQQEGGWLCEKHHKVLSADEQELGCGKHLFIPALLPWKLIDADDEKNYIVYDTGNGANMINRGGGRLEEWKTK
jgi:hypothetical protein